MLLPSNPPDFLLRIERSQPGNPHYYRMQIERSMEERRTILREYESVLRMLILNECWQEAFLKTQQIEAIRGKLAA